MLYIVFRTFIYDNQTSAFSKQRTVPFWISIIETDQEIFLWFYSIFSSSYTNFLNLVIFYIEILENFQKDHSMEDILGSASIFIYL